MQAAGGTTRRRRLIAVAVVGVVLLLVAGTMGLALLSGDRARAGTTVAGIDIGGMSRADAVVAVQQGLAQIADKRIRVRVPGHTVQITPSQAGLSIDAAASVAPAYGRSLNPLTVLGFVTGGRDLPAVVTVDHAALDAQVAAIADTVDAPATEPSLTVSGGRVTLTPGHAGHILDREATAQAIAAAYLAPRTPITAAFTSSEPEMSTAQAKAKAKALRASLAKPITVQATDATGHVATATLRPAAVASAVTFASEGNSLTPAIDGAALHRAVAKDLAALETPGQDASFTIVDGVPQVVPSTTGTGVSDDDLAAAVEKVLSDPSAPRTVNVQVSTRDPKVTTEQAQALGITEKMSSFTQRFPYAAYRVQNIGQAGRSINGTLLLPGDTFSMNETLGERTVKNGYTKGYVVGAGGIFDEQLGGGVSTATTATWTAAFYAGLQRVFTQAHSIYISRYRAGLEATVGWGLFDMKFRNDTPNGVFITAKTTRTSITVTLWGTKQYDEITAESGPRTNIKPYVTIVDTSPTCHAQGGVEGFTITVDRVFHKGGQEVKREPITTNYKPAPEVICEKPPKGPVPGVLPSGAPLPSGAAVASQAASAAATPSPTASASPKPSPKPTRTRS